MVLTVPNTPSASTISPILNGFRIPITMPAIRFSVISWKAKPIAKPIIPAPANNEVTVPFKPTKSKQMKIPINIKQVLRIAVIKSAIWWESNARLNTLRITLPAIRANKEKKIIKIIATIKLGIC